MDFIKTYQSEVNQALKVFWDDYLQSSWDAPEKALIEAMRYATENGGKRFRPILALCVLDLGKPIQNRETILKALCSLELVHAYSLVHDDLPALDNDTLRRGQPTVWNKYDECTAVLVGDGLQTLAFENLYDLDFTPELANHLGQVLSQAIGMEGMLGGQQRDIYFESHTQSLADLEKTHHLKTGALIKASALWGGLLGRLDMDQLALVAQYAQNLGLLFQIKDDLLDHEGDESVVGKKLGKDTENKGYVYLMGIEKTKERFQVLRQKTLKQAKELNSEKLEALVNFVCDREF